ncbi:hypothetical protein DEO72_LG8g2803 [Vigna unguiculata]|uniref:Uncharacterized protein n=1 Tax=Vigna unguiculata TaxID=3917 RepID=A0A4D6MVJ1_VIGUN|nr:hypothetical protein DEO72_LG8g2803 [Vigna unguiculata]
MSEKKPREITIKLLCPSLSKVAQVVAWEDQRIDLGSISRAFGLDPSTLRLNGYFISRGVDLIASSLTWNSLLSFFSSKGLSTGRDQCDALLVTGKLCKVGLKRGHDSLDFQDGIGKMIESENAVNNKGIQLQIINLIKNKKLKESSSVSSPTASTTLTHFNGLFSDIGDKIDDHSGSIARNQFTCSYASKNMKRIREDEAIVAANYKRIR